MILPLDRAVAPLSKATSASHCCDKANLLSAHSPGQEDTLATRKCPITLTARVDELQGAVDVPTSGHPEIDPWVGNLAVLRVKSEMGSQVTPRSCFGRPGGTP